jgi:predicted negative regulator of RcsB-dependent stress response
MKSERRHELQTNALADWLGETIDRIRPYQTSLLGVVLLVVLLILGGTFWIQHSSGQTTEAWGKISTALNTGNAAELDDVIDHYPKTQAANMAAVLAGDMRLFAGTQQRFANLATANDDLSKAIEYYQGVTDDSKSSMLVERATFGWARALETQGKLDDAEKKYHEVTKRWPRGTYAQAAVQRLEDLQKPAIKSFYDQFAHFDPKPSYTSEPAMPSKSGLSKPDSLNEPGEGPVFKHEPLIKLDGDEKGSKDKGTDAKPAEKGK